MRSSPLRSGALIEGAEAQAYTVPTDTAEADGTFAWDSTTLVLVQVRAGGEVGVGFSYTDAAAATLVQELLSGLILGREAYHIADLRERMLRRVRNVGRPGLATMAISAVEVALWDLKGKLLGLPVASLLGAARESVPVYASGGFTTHEGAALARRVRAWGIDRVKIKVGGEAAEDLQRVEAVREALGEAAEIFVDANGAYDRKEALAMADRFAALGVTWFEEPVSSEDLEGLRLLRDRAPAGMEIAAGEYGHGPVYFRRMLSAGSVDVLMPDATRCGGITGVLEAGVLCRAFEVPLSSHCAPAIHLHACLAVPEARHLEYFFDHARIEHMFFDGAPEPVDGTMSVDPQRAGLGLDVRWEDVKAFRS